MTAEQFIYWLQEFLKLSENKTINEKQVKIIKDNLASISKKESSDKKESTDMIKTKKIQQSDPRQLSFNFFQNNLQ
jgi:hypothetical protein